MSSDQSDAEVIYSDLQGKTILVTGAARGIGYAICQALAKQKAHIVFNYRTETPEIKEKVEELKKLGAQVTPMVFDVTDETKIKEEIGAFTKNGGNITGLVNNAGISKDQIVLRLKEADIMETLNINLAGAIRVTSALSRSFLKAQKVSVVNISSVVGLMGNPSQIAYASSKAGLIGFTKSYAKELASRNIRCNAVCPGLIETDMTSALGDEVKEEYLKSIPLNRYGQAKEVAALTCFLLSNTSSYITGETIKVDGGMYI